MSFLEKRDQFKEFKEIPQSQPWFKVFDIGNDIIAIYEPYHFQEVISYLIKDKDKALLWDTGLGIGDMKKCVKELWDKELIVVNSHRHFDHIGSNYQFDKVMIFNHPEMIKTVTNKLDDELVKTEYALDQFTDDAPIKSFDYKFNPITFETFEDGHEFDLGSRCFRVINTPGHADDEIMLVNDKEKILFTGDEYYPAPLYCFEDTFDKYIETMGILKDKYKDYTLITSHNEPYRKGTIFKDVYEGFLKIKNKEVKPIKDLGEREMYKFDTFELIKKKEGK